MSIAAPSGAASPQPNDLCRPHLEHPPNFPAGCYVEVFAGAGGTDCADWAGMLLRMYAQWAQRRGCPADILHATPCPVSSGYRHAVLKCAGDSLYGWLRGEAGVHRLVRVSPFDSERRRHTSFAKVVIYPDVDEFDALAGSSSSSGGGGAQALTRDDVRIETFRSSGPGGKCPLFLFGRRRCDTLLRRPARAEDRERGW